MSIPTPAADAEVPAQPLGKTVRAALGWSFLGSVVGRVGTSLVGIVLANVLAVADYGEFAVALVVLAALLSMNELGVSLAVVRWPGDVRRIAPTVMTLAVGSSALLYVLCFLIAPSIASALNAPDAVGLLRVLSLSVLIDAATAVPVGLMTRAFMQKRRLLIDLATFVVSSVTSVTLALAGFGAWSLVWGTLLGNLLSAVVVFWRTPQRVRPGFDLDIARELLAFGLPLAGASVLTFAMLNVDYIVVGSSLGKVALGTYLLAFNLSSWPVKMISTPVRRVSMRTFARIHEDTGDTSDAFAKGTALLVATTLPVCLLLGLFARPLVEILYKPEWLPSAGPLRFLAVLALVRVMTDLAYDLLVALGRSRINLGLQALWLGILVPALLLGSRLGGVRGVAAGHAVVAVAIVGPAYVVMLAAAGISLHAVSRLLVRPLLGGALAVVASLAVLAAVDQPFWEVAIGGVLSMTLYAAVVHPLRALARSS